ncbi:XkdX family protein [Bacillus swezeyi]|uniref:XkdX family protein n=1 Tax=Bacillus swezeyi TaxID=1925020 RepID=UPI0027DAFEE7|nr:XkdX family protein [Bacillus swezeyi]MED1739094.1 XkdX family protein [Bacillus swezeyi]
MNFWILALYYKWATVDVVKEAIHLEDCTLDDIKEGVEKKLISEEQYQELAGEEFKLAVAQGL